MALKIVWTTRALQGFDRIIDYLEKEWTEKEISTFVEDTFEFLRLL